MKATNGLGELTKIENCWIEVLGEKIIMNALPDISDSKSASFNDEVVMGRTTPIKTYSHSETRQISWQAHFYVTDGNVDSLAREIRLLQSAAYPRDGKNGAPYVPPPICKIKCGDLLSTQSEGIQAVLRQYSAKFPTDVAWVPLGNVALATPGDTPTFYPTKVDLDLTFEIVYSSDDLPGQSRILKLGG